MYRCGLWLGGEREGPINVPLWIVVGLWLGGEREGSINVPLWSVVGLWLWIVVGE